MGIYIPLRISLFFLQGGGLVFLLGLLAWSGLEVVVLLVFGVLALGTLLGSLLGRGGTLARGLGLGGAGRRSCGGVAFGVASTELFQDGLAEVLAVLLKDIVVSFWSSKEGNVGRELDIGRECWGSSQNVRHCVLGKGVTKAVHDLLDARPVVASLGAILVAHNDGDAEVTLGRVIPLLFKRGHGGYES